MISTSFVSCSMITSSGMLISGSTTGSVVGATSSSSSLGNGISIAFGAPLGLRLPVLQ